MSDASKPESSNYDLRGAKFGGGFTGTEGNQKDGDFHDCSSNYNLNNSLVVNNINNNYVLPSSNDALDPKVEMQELKKRYKELLNNPKKSASDFEQFNALSKRMEKLSQKSEDFQSKYQNYQNNWDKHIHKIDYSLARKCFEPVINQLQKQEGAALFLLQNYAQMEGRLCLKSLKEELTQKGIKVHRECQIKFGDYYYGNGSPIDFLIKLGEHLGEIVSDNFDSIQEPLEKITHKICGLFLTSGVVFIELEVKDTHTELLDWFIKHFWVELVAKLPSLKQKYIHARFITIITTNHTLSSNWLKPYLTKVGRNFDCQKIIDLKLKKWGEDEIKHWINEHSQLTELGCYAPEEIMRMIPDIPSIVWKNSNKGLPKAAHADLLNQLETAVKTILKL